MRVLPDRRLREVSTILVVAVLGLFATLPVFDAAAGPDPDGSTGLQSRAASWHLPGGILQLTENAAIESVAAPAATGGGKILTTLFSDDFESGFPGTAWTRTYVDDGPFWEAWTCWANSGTHSVGCAAGGTSAISCGETYPNNLVNWMRFGPVDLSDPDYASGTLECFLNLRCEEMVGDVVKDYFYIGASLDGTDFEGYIYAGVGAQVISMDLTAMPTSGNLLDQSNVWFAFAFNSAE